jgi:uncharacterized short protein YbdD (DUF466 family)
MSTRPEGKDAAAPPPGAEPGRDAQDAAPGLAARWRSVCGACRQVFGIPDYERYLAHAAARHPGAPVLTREEYGRQAIERRYGGKGGGMRCC